MLAPASRGTTWDTVGGDYGHDVTFVEFDGGHTVPPDVVGRAADALEWSGGPGAP